MLFGLTPQKIYPITSKASLFIINEVISSVKTFFLNLRTGLIPKLIFEINNSLNNLEKFVSLNGANNYKLPLNKEKINHTVLNAKNHEREAEIIANAGKINSVIITTSISGRGVDIQLGGKKGSILEDELKIEKENEYDTTRTF